ncbi:LacI family DNA-binding transcriptional regulator [Nostocoides australiense]
MSRITMKDVAQVMGVSVMTVSNAFNRPDQLSPELRERILSRATKMGYAAPNAAARALRQGRTNAYGVVFADSLTYAFADPFTVEWLAGFAEGMEPTRSSIVLMSVPADDAAGLEAVRNTSVDGIAAACTSHPIMDAARAQGLPMVAGDPGPGAFVSIDERAAGAAVASHLRRLGHERIWLLLGATFESDRQQVLDIDTFVASLSRIGPGLGGWERLAGILDGLHGLDVTVLQAGRWDRSAGQDAATLALDRSDRPTAVIGLSDSLALGFIAAMAARGLQPGSDISVSGFDDIPEAATAGLTTVHQPIHEKGRRTAELLLDPSCQPRQVTLAHNLIVRTSTGPR